ncbi:hypothetical protein CPB86DRAFT_385101 [Serendipita vermifera]|nr:hypothetical protein CPB86DRAFT_385101 [Serendipita vermifera]
MRYRRWTYGQEFVTILPVWYETGQAFFSPRVAYAIMNVGHIGKALPPQIAIRVKRGPARYNHVYAFSTLTTTSPSCALDLVEGEGGSRPVSTLHPEPTHTHSHDKEHLSSGSFSFLACWCKSQGRFIVLNRDGRRYSSRRTEHLNDPNSRP